jgi:hypothetical protein
LDVEKRIFNSGRVIIEACPEIPTTGLTRNDVDELIENTRKVMIKKYEELNREIEATAF